MLKLLILSFLISTPLLAEFSNTRIVGVNIYDQGINGANDPAIDISQGVCGEEPETTAEPFKETVVGITITNQSLFDIRFNKVRFRLRNNPFKPFNRGGLAPIGSSEVSSKQTTEIKAFLLDIDGGQKYFYGSDQPVPATGFGNLEIIIVGKNFKGQKVRLKSKTAITFHDLDRCQ